MYAETIFLNCTEIMHEKFVKSEQCEIKKRKKMFTKGVLSLTR